jgi:hypothetical protein
MPEIVSVILEHVQPADACVDDVDEADAEIARMTSLVLGGGSGVSSHGRLRASNTRAAAAKRAALFCALLVSRTWCTAALRLLWRCPVEQALAADAVVTAERRGMYARLIRHVHISSNSALLRALSPAVGDVDDDYFDNHIADSLGARNAISGADSNTEDGSGDSIDNSSAGINSRGNDVGRGSSGRCHGGALLQLPRLTLLHVERYSHDADVWSLDKGEELSLRHQAPLVRLISADLEELRCHLTAAVVGRLIALQAAVCLMQQPRALQPPQPQKAGQPALRLRRLHLYGRYLNTSRADIVAQERLVGWLTQEPNPLPALSSVVLDRFMGGAASSLADRVFGHCAKRGGIERLWPGGVVSQNAIERLANEMRGRPPFPQLRHLTIEVSAAAAVAPLARLLPAAKLTHLHLAVGDSSPGATAAPVLQLLATALTQLRVLRVHLARNTPILGSDLRLLAGLVHLVELEVDNYCGGSDASDDDVAAMLAAMRHLRILQMWHPLPNLSCWALRVIGAACPLLRRLKVLTCGDWFVGPTLAGEADGGWDEATARAEQKPLLPCLEVLSVGPIDPWRYPDFR